MMRALWFVLVACLLAAGCAEEIKEDPPHKRTWTRKEPKPTISYEQYRMERETMRAQFDRADQETVRLQPKDFPDLPQAVLQELERRACTIPQPWTAKAPENIIEGHFTVPDQIDLAVLCSRKLVSSILVFRKRSTEDVAELASVSDETFLQNVGDNRIGYSRALGVADPQRIRHHNGDVSPVQFSLDHDGLEDHFLEKASTIWYWHEGQWLDLPGAD